MLSVRDARKIDPIQLAPFLRQADQREIEAASGALPVAALLQAHIHSTICKSIVDLQDYPVAMYGVVPSPLWEKAGVIWMLCSTFLVNQTDYRWQFLRQCRNYLPELHRQYPLLYNAVDERNTLHIRWLKWMGFTFIRRIEHYGVEQRPFLEFVRLDNV